MESQEHIFMINSSVERTRGNRAINAAEDENYGEILKSGDNTLLRYKIFDGDGEILQLEGLPCEAVIKKEDIVVYRTPAEVDAENVVSFKITEVLPSDRNNPYTIEFIITQGQDTLIFPSDDRINLYMYPSSLSAEVDIIEQTPEERLNEIVIVAVNDATQDFYSEVDEFRDTYNELIDTGVIQENINQKLSESEQTYAPRLTNLEQNDADLTAQLADTADEVFYDSLVNAKEKKKMLVWIDDDGAEAFYHFFKPLAIEYGVTFTSAIPTTWIGREGRITLEQMREMQDLGIGEFVSHGHSHDTNKRLTDMTVEELHEDLSTSKEIMRDLGFNSDTIVYGFGAQNEQVRNVVRQYFRAGIRTAVGFNNDALGGINEDPIDQFNLARIDVHKGNNRIFPLLDEASDKNTGVILMSHVNQTGWPSEAEIRQLIAYALSKGFEFVTMTEYLNRTGNLAQFGSTTISNDGKIYDDDLINVLKSRSVRDVEVYSELGDYEVGKITMRKVTSGDFQHIYKLPSWGFLYTLRDHEDSYSHQIFVPSAKDHKSLQFLYRFWDDVENEWGSFSTLNGAKIARTPIEYGVNAPISEFTQEQITVIMVRLADASANNLPTAGVVEVYRFYEETFSFQRYTSLDGEISLTRKWDSGSNSWADWKSPTPVTFTQSLTAFTPNDPITSFPKEKITIIKVGINNASEFGLDKAGVIEVIRLNEDYYSFQRYTSVQGVVKTRNWNTTTSTWKEWV